MFGIKNNKAMLYHLNDTLTMYKIFEIKNNKPIFFLFYLNDTLTM